jgi:hypothetical protein
MKRRSEYWNLRLSRIARRIAKPMSTKRIPPPAARTAPVTIFLKKPSSSTPFGHGVPMMNLPAGISTSSSATPFPKSSVCVSGKFTRRVETMVDEIHNAPRVEGVDRIYVPGEMEWERYDRAIKEGIQLPPDVLTSLQEAARMAGLDLAELST